METEDRELRGIFHQIHEALSVLRDEADVLDDGVSQVRREIRETSARFDELGKSLVGRDLAKVKETMKSIREQLRGLQEG